MVEAVGHGRQPGITHEYRGRTFESRFLPKALVQLVVEDEKVEQIVSVIGDAASTGDVGSGIVWTSPIGLTRHIRTGQTLEEFGE